jgi:transcriptional regulator with XRE-family HTH domain
MIHINEKIRLIRQARGWTQEEVADKLDLSVNAYGEIERGNSDIRLSRLEQIASLFGLELDDLVSATETIIFNFINSTASGTLNNFSNSLGGQMEMQTEIEKLQLMLQLKDKEIELRDEKIRHLSEVVELLKTKDLT